MRWVTRENVHLDRVASPWLIRRSIDPDAEFVFIDPDKPWPADAIPFALPGAELGMHDENGSTFDKLLRHYQLDDPVLHDIADVVRAGIRHLFGEDQQGATTETLALGVALLALSEGLMLRWPADHDNIQASGELYDGLYAYFWARRMDPRFGPETFWERMASLRAAWRAQADATT